MDELIKRAKDLLESSVVKVVIGYEEGTGNKTRALFVENADKTILILPKETTNTFTDGTSYIITPDSLNAAIFSKDNIGIYGEGTLIVNGNYKGGISSHDKIDIQSGNININSVTTGIRG